MAEGGKDRTARSTPTHARTHNPTHAHTRTQRFVGKARRIPDDIVEDPELKAAIAQLPANYNFEVHKTVWRAREVRM